MRAFSECIQMIYSLDSGIAVTKTPSDMRYLWYSGLAETTFPNLFCRQQSSPEHLFSLKREEEDLSLEDLVNLAHRQGLEVYSQILAKSPHVSVVKVVLSHIAVSDSTYFKNGIRLAHFASLQGHSTPVITYSDSLFM